MTTPLQGGGVLNSGPFYHGTKAGLKPGDSLAPGYRSNYGERRKAHYVYLTAALDAAVWGRSLRRGTGPAVSTVWNPPVPSGMAQSDE